MKKIIVNADDLGINIAINKAIKEASTFGILKSACIIVNYDEYENTIKDLSSLNLDIGIHLNISEGKSLDKDVKHFLTNKAGGFNQNFIDLLLKSNSKNYLKQIEKEFRLQIEKMLNSGLKPSFICSHIHIHSIPKIFELTCKLANEYKIEKIRLQKENFYLANNKFNFKFILGITKNIILNIFSKINEKKLLK